ncbi:hypothetical protein [Paenibacillus sp. J31TS4]|uniref:hypothetical protein n=1 Tax=Paenibacillus sp. J31TS4 TaxID=2807195 RepID=UPI001BD1B3C4|nr:hypothetical protein [Paenibacillus sp. J31TS4]
MKAMERLTPEAFNQVKEKDPESALILTYRAGLSLISQPVHTQADDHQASNTRNRARITPARFCF